MGQIEAAFCVAGRTKSAGLLLFVCVISEHLELFSLV
nr:MAG TPA: hypothetical protein [Caudoviricetes sp.]